jgi:hypothetical protein
MMCDAPQNSFASMLQNARFDETEEEENRNKEIERWRRA